MGLLDGLSELFYGGGGSGDPSSPGLLSGLASNGAAPPPQPQASPAPQVLARLNPPAPSSTLSPGGQASANPMAQMLARLLPPSAQGGGTSPNPLGLSPAIGGNDLGIALSGLSQVRPGSGRFSAFAQGLAGGLSARANAQVENAKLATQQQAAALDSYLKAMQIGSLQRQQDGAAAAYDIMKEPSGGAASSPAPAAPSAPPGSPPATPAASLAPAGTPADPSAAPVVAQASPPPAGAPAAAPVGQPTGQPALPSYFSPRTVIARIQRLNAAGDAALGGGDGGLATTFYNRATQEQTRLEAMVRDGKSFDANGNGAWVPWSARQRFWAHPVTSRR